MALAPEVTVRVTVTYDPEQEPLLSTIKVLAEIHQPDFSGIRCNCGQFMPCDVQRLLGAMTLHSKEVPTE